MMLAAKVPCSLSLGYHRVLNGNEEVMDWRYIPRKEEQFSLVRVELEVVSNPAESFSRIMTEETVCLETRLAVVKKVVLVEKVERQHAQVI